jgi:hypothetical protein
VLVEHKQIMPTFVQNSLNIKNVRTAYKCTKFRAAKLSADRRVGRKFRAFIDIDIVTRRDDDNEIEICFCQIYNLL